MSDRSILSAAKPGSGKYKRQIPLHFMMIPAIVITAIFAYVPMFGLIMAFQDFVPAKGFLGSAFVGLANFTRLFNMRGVTRLFWNTFYISAMKVVANQIFPIILAVLLNEIRIRFFKKTVQTILYLPYFISWVILGGILKDFLALDGMVNGFLGILGIQAIPFLGSNAVFPYTLVVTDLWQNAGFNTVVFLAAITSVNLELYEAATVDGANRARLCWHITLPAMRPIIILTATLALGNLFQAGFDQVFMLYNVAVMESGDIIDTFVYRTGILAQQYSLGTAVGLFKSIVSLILVSSSYYLAYRFSDYRIF